MQVVEKGMKVISWLYIEHETYYIERETESWQKPPPDQELAKETEPGRARITPVRGRAWSIAYRRRGICHNYLTPFTCRITSVPSPKYTIVTVKSAVYPI